MWLLRLSLLVLLLWLLLFEWIENIIKYFMYSQFENLCNKKLGFVSFEQNSVSYLLSYVDSFLFYFLLD
jgi:hypothetical protein